MNEPPAAGAKSLKAEVGSLKIPETDASQSSLQPSDFRLPTFPKVLVACIGNIFLGDDAFGVEVAKRLTDHPLPEGVAVVDFGIRGLDLTYALLDDDYDGVILVDAVPRGGAPGTLYVIEPDPVAVAQAKSAPPDPAQPMLDTHNMDPAKVLRLVVALGGGLDRILLLGCEPSPAKSYEEMASGLTAPVRAAVDEALGMIDDLAREMLAPPPEVAPEAPPEAPPEVAPKFPRESPPRTHEITQGDLS